MYIRGDFVKQIRDTQHYISEDGRVYNTKTKKYLSGSLDKDGYRRFRLNGLNVSFHRILMEVFNPVENMSELEVNHINGNKDDNTLANLEWSTRKENMEHLINSGLSKKCSNKGTQNGRAKLNENDVLEIKRLLQKGLSYSKIAEQFGVGKTAISDIKNGKTWSHIQE